MLKQLAIRLTTALLLIANSVLAQAQDIDTQAPTLIYRPAASGGQAGELQTFVARVSDDSDLRSVALYYRQDSTTAFQRIEMRRLFDSIDEYMIAIETSRTAAGPIDYFLEAVDVNGNVQRRGSQTDPLQLTLLPPDPLAQSPTPATPAVTSETSPSRGWIIGIAALLAVAALAGGGGDASSGGSADTVPLTIFSPTPNQ
jgi:hypothetical protein